MKNIFKKIAMLLAMIIEDLFIIGGVFIINVTTYKLSLIAGLYATGITLLLIGIYLAKYPIKRGG